MEPGSFPQNKDKIKQNCKVFLGGLHLETTEDDLREFYQEFGEIVDCVVMRDGNTKKSRGFGFVTFSNPSSVDKCLENKPHVISGREVDSKRAVPKDDSNPMAHAKTKRIFIGGLGPGIGGEELREYFEREYGAVSAVEVPTDKATGRGRGFAFVDLEDFDKVDKACIQRHHEICGRNCEVKKAETKESMRIKDSLAQEKATRDMRSMRSQQPPPSMYDSSPYGAYYGGKSYFGRGYPPMTFSPFMSPGVYTASMYDAGGYSRESYSRGATSPRRMDPYASAGAASYSTGGSPYAAGGSPYAAGGGSSYYSNMEREKMMGSYFGAGYSQLPSSFGPSRDYSRERDSSDIRDRKYPASSSISSRSYHPYH